MWKSKKIKRSNRRGFLLLEALLALAVLSAGVCALSESFSLARLSLKRGNDDQQAAVEAERKILEILVGPGFIPHPTAGTRSWSIEHHPQTFYHERFLVSAPLKGHGRAVERFEFVGREMER